MDATGEHGRGAGTFRPVLLVPLVVLSLWAACWVTLSSPAHGQASSVLVINVDERIVRSGLALTKLGVAEGLGDQYTVGGAFFAARKPSISSVTLRILTSSGKTLSRSAPLQGGILSSYAFVVFLPRQEGEIKIITITR